MAILKSYYKMYRTLPEPDYFYIKNEYNGNNTLNVNLYSNYFSVGDGEYKLNDGNWTPLTYGTTNKITIPANGKVYFRATNWGKNIYGTNTQMSCTQNFSVGGNVLTINDYTNVETATIKNHICNSMFYAQTKLIKADINIGNVTSLSEGFFLYCFNGCTSLTSAPDFSSLTNIKKNCFYGCFNGCTNLTKVPDFSNVISVEAGGFTECFRNCTSLTNAPDFSNITTTGDSSFQNCFNGCTNLTTAPDFSNITTVVGMGFAYCFQNCSKLNYVYAPSVSSWNTSTFSSWLAGVASYGIIRKKSSLNIPTGTSGCPANWDFENIN